MSQLTDDQREQLTNFIKQILALSEIDGKDLIRQMLVKHGDDLDDYIWNIEEHNVLSVVLVSHLRREPAVDLSVALLSEVRTYLLERDYADYLQMVEGLQQVSKVSEKHVEPSTSSIFNQPMQTVQGNQTNVSGNIESRFVNTGNINLFPLLNDTVKTIPAPNPPEPLQEIPNWMGREAELTNYPKYLSTRGCLIITGAAGIGKTYLATAVAKKVQNTESKIFWHRFQRSDELQSIINYFAECLAFYGQASLWTEICSDNNTSLENRSRSLIHLLQQDDYVVFVDGCDAIDPKGMPEDDNAAGNTHRRYGQIWDFLERLYHAATRSDNSLCFIMTSRRPPGFANACDIRQLTGILPEQIEGFIPNAEIPVQIQEYTGGNPHYLNILKIMSKRGDDLSWILESKVTNPKELDFEINQRFDDHLNNEERFALRAMAIMGGRFISKNAIASVADNLEAWKTLVGLDQEGVVLSRKHRDGSGYDYSVHDMFIEFYGETNIDSTLRDLMHLRAGNYFETERKEKNLSEALWHYFLAQDFAAAVRLAKDATKEIFSQGYKGRLLETYEKINPGFFNNKLDELIARTAEGEVRARSGQEKLAKEILEGVLEASIKLEDSDVLSDIQGRACAILSLFERRKNPQKALVYAEQGLKAIDGNFYATTRAELYMRRAQASIHFENYSDSLEDLDRAEELNRGEHKVFITQGILNARGSIAMKQGKFALAEQYYQEALEQAEKIGDLYGALSAQITLSSRLYYQGVWRYQDNDGKWKGAIPQNEQSLQRACDLDSYTHRIQILNNLGYMYLNLGDFEQALNRLLDCIELARKRYVNEYLISAKSTLCDLYLRQGESEKALEEILGALDLVQNEHKDQLAELNRNLALCYLAQHKTDKAKETIELSLAQAKFTSIGDDLREDADPLEVGMSLRMLGDIEAAVGDLPVNDIVTLYDKSADLVKDDKYEYARTRMQKGMFLLQAGHSQDGSNELLIAYETFKILGAKHDLYRIVDKFTNDAQNLVVSTY